MRSYFLIYHYYFVHLFLSTVQLENFGVEVSANLTWYKILYKPGLSLKIRLTYVSYKWKAKGYWCKYFNGLNFFAAYQNLFVKILTHLLPMRNILP